MKDTINNTIALLEECLKNGNRPTSLYAWFMNEEFLIKQTLLELNAGLLHAAPELYENLVYLDSIMPDLIDVGDDEYIEITITGKAAHDIQQAIKKARKET